MNYHILNMKMIKNILKYVKTLITKPITNHRICMIKKKQKVIDVNYIFNIYNNEYSICKLFSHDYEYSYKYLNYMKKFNNNIFFMEYIVNNINDFKGDKWVPNVIKMIYEVERKNRVNNKYHIYFNKMNNKLILHLYYGDETASGIYTKIASHMGS